jgi:AcrR family transcriptional regulator
MTSVMSEAPDSAESINERARRVVRASGLSQRQFADLLGMDQTALSKALRGNRRLSDDELSAIAEHGRVPLRFLTHDGAQVPARLVKAEGRGTRLRADPLDAEARRRQILSATAHLIASRGFHNVRVADIARACETSPSTLHYHFESKDDALRSALVFYAERLHAELEHEFAGTEDPREKLRRLIEVQLPQTDDDVDEWSIWMQSWNEALFQPELREVQLAAYQHWRRTVLDRLQECVDAGLLEGGDVELLATRFTAMVDGLAIQLLASTDDMTVDRMREVLLDSFEPHLRLR